MDVDVEYMVDRAAECTTCWGTGYTESLSMSWTEADFIEYTCHECSEPEEDFQLDCPRPRYTRGGDYECPRCGLTGSDGGFPFCGYIDSPEARKARLHAIAAIELRKIRAILSGPRPPRRY